MASSTDKALLDQLLEEYVCCSDADSDNDDESSDINGTNSDDSETDKDQHT